MSSNRFALIIASILLLLSAALASAQSHLITVQVDRPVERQVEVPSGELTFTLAPNSLSVLRVPVK
jgi:hypothetical protein